MNDIFKTGSVSWNIRAKSVMMALWSLSLPNSSNKISLSARLPVLRCNRLTFAVRKVWAGWISASLVNPQYARQAFASMTPMMVWIFCSSDPVNFLPRQQRNITIMRIFLHRYAKHRHLSATSFSAFTSSFSSLLHRCLLSFRDVKLFLFSSTTLCQ